MQKIELKVNSDKLNVIITVLNRGNENLIHATDIGQKATRSVIHEMLCQLSKKNIDKSDSQKQFKITLKYHQGYMLREKLLGFGSVYSQESIYEKSLANTMAIKIHEQL